MSGRFLLPRGWMQDFPDEKFTRAQAYAWSVENAAFAPHRRMFSGRHISLQRGEFVTSVRHMALTFRWSEKAVRTFQAWAQSERKWAQRLAWEGARSPTIITVCNYDDLQSFNADTGTAATRTSGTARAQRGHSKGTLDNKGNEGDEGNYLEESYQGRACLGSPTRTHTHAREDWA